MRNLVAGLLTCLLFIPHTVRAETSVSPERIAGYVAQLGSPKFLDREVADRELRRIGEAALPLLKAALVSKDNEVRYRAEIAIRAIERRIENDRLILAPKLRLKYDKVPLDQAIADLAKQTGLPFRLDPKATVNAKQTLTLDTGDVPYWEAVEKFLTTVGLVEISDPVSVSNVNQYGHGMPQLGRNNRGGSVPTGDGTLRLIDAKSPLSASVGTAIRVKALPKEISGNGAVKGTNEIRLLLEVSPTPELAWQGLVNVDIRKVVDDRDMVLAQSHLSDRSPNETITHFNGGGQVFIVQGKGQVIIQGNNVMVMNSFDGANPTNYQNPRHVAVSLIGRDSSTKFLKEIHGVIAAQVLGPAQPIVTIDDVLNASAKSSAEKGQYQLQIIERIDKGTSVQIKFQQRMPVQNDVFVQQFDRARGGLRIGGTANGTAQPELVIQDSNGKAMRQFPLQISQQSFDGITQTSVYTVVLPKGARETAPAKLTLNGRQPTMVEVPFSLKNVQLP